MWPCLQAIRELDGSATGPEMNERAMELAGLSEAQQAIPHGSEGRISEVEYRLNWARTYLKGIGALENSSRGVWSLTDHGRTVTEDAMNAETRIWKAEINERHRSLRAKEQLVDEDEVDAESEEMSWKDILIDRLLKLPPDGFERLAQRILREAGFVNVMVTGKAVMVESMVPAPTASLSSRFPSTFSASVTRVSSRRALYATSGELWQGAARKGC